jgi:glucose-1-phosphate thymidylyltransferase
MNYLLENNIMSKGEYQLTDAMENMKNNGVKFYTGQVEEWLDCGNKDATLYTLERMLEIKKDLELMRHASSVVENSTIIEPCFIGANVSVKNAVVGPYVSLENGSIVEHAIISHSIVGAHSAVKNSIIKNSLLGNHVDCQSKSDELSLGDYSFKL